MRELTLTELELVSGGTFTLDDVDVVGDRWQPIDWSPPYDYGDNFTDGGGTDTPPPPPEQLPTCVTDKPAITNEEEFLNNLKLLTDELRGLYNSVPGNTPIDASRYEYGILIYEINGVIGYGDIQTSNSAGHVDITAAGVPDGARIIAYMHNHPDQAGIDDRWPSNHSGGDWDQRDALVNSTLARGITVDPNLLLVLYTNQDDKTRIYDKSDKNKTVAACAIN